MSTFWMKELILLPLLKPAVDKICFRVYAFAYIYIYIYIYIYVCVCVCVCVCLFISLTKLVLRLCRMTAHSHEITVESWVVECNEEQEILFHTFTNTFQNFQRFATYELVPHGWSATKLFVDTWKLKCSCKCWGAPKHWAAELVIR